MNDFYARSLAEFKAFSQIPHCSFHTKKAFSYLCEKLQHKGYEVQTDKAGNIYAKKGKPKVCLQAHYDMVCVGECTNGVETYEEKGFLRARNSSLGADNGAAVACMLALDSKDIELLITNDEEVGMLGANALELMINSHLLLNLDSENINEITVSGAGGADIECKINLRPFMCKISEIKTQYPYAYKITSSEFLGGHSGIEIHKNKANVIVEFGYYFNSIDAYIVAINAGEKRNAIPTGLEAILLTSKPLEATISIEYTLSNALCKTAYFHTQPLNSLVHTEAYTKDAIIPLLVGFHNGVYSASNEGILASLNLSLLRQNNDILSLVMMARANTDKTLSHIIKRLKMLSYYLNSHCDISTIGFYGAWERSIADNHQALRLLKTLYESHHIYPLIAQIHAGLESGVIRKQLLDKCPTHNVDALSIGPNIYAPHSINESLDLQSYAVFCDILERFVADF